MRPHARRKYLLALLEGAAWGALLSVLVFELALLVLLALGIALLFRSRFWWGSSSARTSSWTLHS